MLTILVYVQVKVESVQAFIDATLENAAASRQEPGVLRFDVMRNHDHPTHFVLSEVYRSPEAAAQHKETAHYQTWRDAVASMMAVPRRSEKYEELALPDRRQETPR